MDRINMLLAQATQERAPTPRASATHSCVLQFQRVINGRE